MRFVSLALLTAALALPVSAKFYFKEQFNDEVSHCRL